MGKKEKIKNIAYKTAMFIPNLANYLYFAPTTIRRKERYEDNTNILEKTIGGSIIGSSTNLITYSLVGSIGKFRDSNTLLFFRRNICSFNN